LLKGDMIKKGAFVIDAGTSESSGGIVGDADFDSVSIKAGFLTPVPGGVGPVTVAMLIKNSLESASRLEKK
jgi:methylenetetrahydrofolate dehydrogenase (NADP+)/methenyltetrahydrofolate cyclohydrolase